MKDVNHHLLSVVMAVLWTVSTILIGRFALSVDFSEVYGLAGDL